MPDPSTLTPLALQSTLQQLLRNLKFADDDPVHAPGHDHHDPGRMQMRKRFVSVKNDQKAKHAWKVIASKLSRSEPDVKTKWNQIKRSSG